MPGYREAMRCFVSAPASVDTGPIAATLRMEGVTFVDALSLHRSGYIVEAIRDAMAESDMVAVVFGSAEPDPAALLIEVGIAIGLAKPLLLVMPRERRPPAMLSAVQYVRADPSDVEAIGLNVRAMVKSLETGSRVKRTSEVPPPPEGLAVWLEEAIAAVRGASGSIESSRMLEGVVAELFERSGGQVEINPHAGPDLAVLMGDRSPLQGVVLVEVKRLRSQRDLRATMHQLQSFVLERGAALGVVAYLRDREAVKPLDPGSVPLLVAIDLGELPGRLEHLSLGEVLAIERNLAIHGM
jgi:hypothetical protein